MKLVVTRHKALIAYLLEIGIIEEKKYKVISQATPEDVKGKVVIGVLPIHLAALTEAYINVGIFTPVELRGVELSIEQVRKFAQPAVTYKITII